MTPSIEHLQAELELARRERDMAQAVAAAAARISRRINERPLDVDGTLVAIAEAARELTRADGARVFIVEGDHLVPGPDSLRASEENVLSFGTRLQKVPLTSPITIATAARERRTEFVDDLLDLRFQRSDAEREGLLAKGIRSLMATPLGRAGTPLGVLVIYRAVPGTFDATQQETLEAFAVQAAVAIETARAQEALAAGMEREASVASVLEAISRTAFDLDAVLATLARNAARLLKVRGAVVWLRNGDLIEPRGFHNEQEQRLRELLEPIPVETEWLGSAALRTRAPTLHVVTHTGGSDPRIDALVESFGEFCVQVEPIIAGDEAIGLISVERPTTAALSPGETTLLRTFADQAGIAVENSRLLSALSERNADLVRSLEQQTATAEVLDVISRSPSNLQAALDAVVARAGPLLDSDVALATRLEADGSEAYVAAARDGEISVRNRLHAPGPAPASGERGSEEARALADGGRTVMRHGGPAAIRSDAPTLAQAMEAVGVNSSLRTPLRTSHGLFGHLIVTRHSPAPYTAAQVRLFETFADQAVIAIENARLFDELQERNRTVSEALEREKATAAVLDVISRSPADLQPVLDRIVALASELLGSDSSLARESGEETQTVAMGHDGARVGTVTLETPHIIARPTGTLNPTNIAIRTQQPMSIHGGMQALIEAWPGAEASFRISSVGSGIVMPIAINGESWGVLKVFRASPLPYSDGQVELLQTFAAQAAIAIENTRLFNELEARNRDVTIALSEQTAMAEVLGIIAASPDSRDGPLQAIIESATRLSEGSLGNLWLLEGDDARLVAQHGHRDDDALLKAGDLIRPDPALLDAMREGHARHLASSHDAVRRGDV